MKTTYSRYAIISTRNQLKSLGIENMKMYECQGRQTKFDPPTSTLPGASSRSLPRSFSLTNANTRQRGTLTLSEPAPTQGSLRGGRGGVWRE